MMRDFWEYFWPLVVIIMAAAIVVAGTSFFVSYENEVQCESRSQMMNMTYAYSWRTGCMVIMQDGSWVPMSSIRVMR